MKTNTPETDTSVIASGGDWSPVLRETCRRLERERDEWAAMCGNYKQERDEAREEWGKASMDAAQLLSEKTKVMAERDEAREALRDMLSGWRYIRKVHGDLYGVGWDRAQTKAEKVLEETK